MSFGNLNVHTSKSTCVFHGSCSFSCSHKVLIWLCYNHSILMTHAVVELLQYENKTQERLKTKWETELSYRSSVLTLSIILMQVKSYDCPIHRMFPYRERDSGGPGIQVSYSRSILIAWKCFIRTAVGLRVILSKMFWSFIAHLSTVNTGLC